MTARSSLLALILPLAAVQAATAHEFWIAPATYLPAPGSTVSADIRVGTGMAGEALPWLSSRTYAAQVFLPDGTIPLTGREGDLPALSVPVPTAGLVRVTYFAEPAETTHASTAEFAAYLHDEGLSDTLALHAARGLPAAGFTEAYIRNARALLQSGPVQPGQSDAPTGMPFELVAAGNPFDPDATQMPVTLTWQGLPQTGHQIALFRRAPDGTVTRDLFRSDERGSVTIPIDRSGEYLLSAVRIDPFDAHPDVVWLSHWASLTFARP